MEFTGSDVGRWHTIVSYCWPEQQSRAVCALFIYLYTPEMPAVTL